MFVLSFAVVSCKKKPHTLSVRGSVFDPNQNIAVANAQVTLSSSKIVSGVYNSNYQDISTVTTDGSGNFSIDFPEEKTAGYRFYITKTNYFSALIDVNTDEITPDDIYAPTYTIYPEAYLKIHVKNTSPFDNMDFVSYKFTAGVFDCNQCCTNTTFKGYGMTYDSIVKCKTRGSMNATVNWVITKNNIQSAFFQNIYCTPFDTSFFDINY